MIRRHVRAALLLGFALLIAKLFAAGEMTKYMSPALDPLTALAGLVLAAMGVVEIAAARAGGHEDDEHPTDRAEQTLTNLLLVIPLAVGFLMAPRALGSAALGGEDVASLLLTFPAGPAPAARGVAPPASPIEDLPDLLVYVRQAGEQGVGQRVRVTGLVARADSFAPNELALLRYAIAHCVADARPLGLFVIANAEASWPADQWVSIEGTLESREREGDRLVSIVAETIVAIEEPRNPYLAAGF